MQILWKQQFLIPEAPTRVLRGVNAFIREKQIGFNVAKAEVKHKLHWRILYGALWELS